jgi:hypothetical protein
MMKISEDNLRITKWPLLNKGHPTAVRTAIEEITNILWAAGNRLASRATAGSNSQACELWATRKGSYLDRAM